MQQQDSIGQASELILSSLYSNAFIERDAILGHEVQNTEFRVLINKITSSKKLQQENLFQNVDLNYLNKNRHQVETLYKMYLQIRENSSSSILQSLQQSLETFDETMCGKLLHEFAQYQKVICSLLENSNHPLIDENFAERIATIVKPIVDSIQKKLATIRDSDLERSEFDMKEADSPGLTFNQSLESLTQKMSLLE